MKKKTNRLIAVLLATVMLVGILPLSVFADEPTLISSLSLGGITAPVAGESTNIAGTAVTGLTGCWVSWYSSFSKWAGSKGDSALTYENKTFSYSNAYTLSLCLIADSGYAFDPSATALTNWTLNGITASKVEMRASDTIVVSFPFPETGAFEGTIIDGLTLGGIDAPVAGESSARNAASITGLEGCTLDAGNSGWYIGTNYSNKLTTWNTPADFEQGTVYSVCLFIDAGVDAMFDTTATAKANWTLNGIPAAMVSIYDTGVDLLFTFPATEITSAYIENAEVIIPFPTSGGSLTASEYTTATVPDDAPYTVSSVTWEPLSGASMTEFTYYGYYTATVTLTPKDMELPFMGLTTLTLNGKSSSSKTVSGGVMTVTSTFMSRPAATATLGNLTIPSKKVGYAGVATQYMPFSVTGETELVNAYARYTGDLDAFQGIGDSKYIGSRSPAEYNSYLGFYHKTGLAAGTYTLTVTLTGDNLAAPVSATVSFTVEPVIFTYRVSADDETDQFTETITETGEHTPPACPFEAPEGKYFGRWQAVSGVNSFTPAGEDKVFTPVFSSYEGTVTFHENGGTLTGSGNVRSATPSVYMNVPIVYGITPPDGKVFLYWAVGSPSSGIHYNDGTTYYLTADGNVDMYAVWSGSKEATPTEVAFAATGYDTGKLTGVSAGLRYQIGTGEVFSIASAADVALTGLASGDTVRVWRSGNGTTTIDSDAVSFTLTRISIPSGIYKEDCATFANNDGQLKGVSSAHEYKKGEDGVWTEITETTVTGLTDGTYYVRYKGHDTVLASESVAITINSFVGTKEPTPSAVFTATGADCGTISNAQKGMVWYTSDDATEHSITGSTASVTGLTGACTIYVVKKGNGTTTYDSDAKEIAVTKGAAPTYTMTPCSDVSNNDGQLSVPNTHEYKLMPDGEWTTGTGLMTGLAGGTIYKVRRRATTSTLASDEETVTIQSFVTIESFNITYEGFAAPALGGDVYRANNFVTGSSQFTFTYGDFDPSWKRYDSVNTYNFAVLGDDSGTVTFAGETVYCLCIYLVPEAGFGFDEANIEGYRFNNMVPMKMVKTVYSVQLYYAFPMTSLPKQATPTAVFTAGGFAGGTLSGVTAGQKYSIDGGTTWTLIEGTSVAIASGITPANGIKVYLPGVTDVSLDSEIQTITVTRGTVPASVKAVPCATAAGNDGKLTGVTSAMEYKIGEGAWTEGTGADVTGLAAGTLVKVRVNASGTALESDEVSFTVAAFSVIPSFNITYDGFAAPAEDGSVYRPNSFTAGEGFHVNYGQTRWKTFNGSYYPDFKFISDTSAASVFAGETVYYLQMTVNAETGFAFDEENGENYKFNNMVPVKVAVEGDGTVVYLTYKFPATSMATQPMPAATFNANGYASGTLSGVKAGQKYSIDGGTTWTLIEGTSVDIASGITPANGIKVYMPGVADESYDSAVQTIEVTRAVVTGVTAVQPTAYSGDGRFGSIVGFNAATMEYSKDGGESWSTYTEWLTNFLAPQTVLVHVKASGTALQSDNATFTINAFVGTKEATPTEVSFVATDRDAGKLVGVSAGLKYKCSDAISYDITSSDDVPLTSLSAGMTITVWRAGNGTTTVDSDAVTFTLTKAATPTGIGAVKPTTVANNDGKLTGVDSTMEYKRISDTSWTAITGTEATGLVPANYDVRVKGNGTQLASDHVSIYIGEYTALPKAATPTAQFRGVGESDGFIWYIAMGGTYEWYTSLDSTRHTATPYDADEGKFTDVRFDVTGLTEACTIYLIYKGDGVTNTDSDAQEITVGKYTMTQEEIFDSITVWPVTASLQRGRITLEGTEYWNASLSKWESVGGTGYISFAWGESITMRKAANGSNLASETMTFSIYSEDQISKAGEVSVTLNENFKMNFYIDLSESEVAAATVVYTFRGNTYEGVVTATGFSFDNIAPQYLGETLNAKLYIGGLLAYERDCSIKSYLEAVTAAYPDNESLQTLANDILVYGGAAQKYVGYKTSELVSEGVTGTTFVPLDASYGTFTLENNGYYVKFKSATVFFDDMISLKIKFEKTTEEPFGFEYNSEPIGYVEDGDVCIVSVPIKAYAICTSSHGFRGVRDYGYVDWLSYEVGNYVYAMQDRDDNMGELARALWNYGLAAKAYYGP